MPSIGVSNVPGSITVMRTVTAVGKSPKRTYKAEVVAPPGFEVTVNPSTFVIGAGGTQTFYVTITNVSAPLGAVALRLADLEGHQRVLQSLQPDRGQGLAVLSA